MIEIEEVKPRNDHEYERFYDEYHSTLKTLVSIVTEKIKNTPKSEKTKKEALRLLRNNLHKLSLAVPVFASKP